MFTLFPQRFFVMKIIQNMAPSVCPSFTSELGVSFKTKTLILQYFSRRNLFCDFPPFKEIGHRARNRDGIKIFEKTIFGLPVNFFTMTYLQGNWTVISFRREIFFRERFNPSISFYLDTKFIYTQELHIYIFLFVLTK